MKKQKKQQRKNQQCSPPTRIFLESLVSVLVRDRWIYEQRTSFQAIKHMSVGLELRNLNSACRLGCFPEKVE